MTADPLLSTFPPPLARLILCGGGGLAEAFGPLTFVDPHYLDRAVQLATWSGQARLAYASDDYDCDAWGMDAFESEKMIWRLPLSHWRPRLALVAAHLIGGMPGIEDVPPCTSAVVITHPNRLSLVGIGPESLRWSSQFATLCVLSHTWHDNWMSREPRLYLPTLPAHLRDHDPAVALILALYDVPEIRARVEAP